MSVFWRWTWTAPLPTFYVMSKGVIVLCTLLGTAVCVSEKNGRTRFWMDLARFDGRRTYKQTFSRSSWSPSQSIYTENIADYYEVLFKRWTSDDTSFMLLIVLMVFFLECKQRSNWDFLNKRIDSNEFLTLIPKNQYAWGTSGVFCFVHINKSHLFHRQHLLRVRRERVSWKSMPFLLPSAFSIECVRGCVCWL